MSSQSDILSYFKKISKRQIFLKNTYDNTHNKMSQKEGNKRKSDLKSLPLKGRTVNRKIIQVDSDSDCYEVEAETEKNENKGNEVIGNSNNTSCSKLNTKLPNLPIGSVEITSKITVLSCSDDDIDFKALDYIENTSLSSNKNYDHTPNKSTALASDVSVIKTFTKFKLEDDATLFLLKMINNYLEDTSLHQMYDTEENNLLRSFYELPFFESKKIFSRLYWRQCKWNSTSDIVLKYLDMDYKKDSIAQKAINDLTKNRVLLSGSQHMKLEDWTEMLKRDDILKICQYFKIVLKKKDKQSAISSLKAFCSSKCSILNHFTKNNSTMENTVLKKISSLFGECIKIHPNCKNTFDKLHLLMYVGMNPVILREKRLNLLLIYVKNGEQYYPAMNFKLDSVSCVFRTRAHFIEYYRAYCLYENIFKLFSTKNCDHESIIKLCAECLHLYQSISKEDHNDLLSTVPVWLHRYTPGYLYVKALELGIGSYKSMNNQKHLNEGIKVIETLLEQSKYRQHKRALWFDELALIYQSKEKNYNKAADILIQALAKSDITDDAKGPLQKRARRLADLKISRLDPQVCEKLRELSGECKEDLPLINIEAKCSTQNFPGRKAMYYQQDEDGDKIYSSVEDNAVMYYLQNTDYVNGEHWEGRIITSFFVLLFWDIIYCPLEAGKAVFLSPYQEAPLDLYTDAFYNNRKAVIDKRLDSISHFWLNIDEVIEYMKNVFDLRKKGELSMYHEGIEWNKLSGVATCLGQDGLTAICKRLAHSYHYAHSGFPDLTLWNESTKKIKFVEVKGEGDRLSVKQIQWINYLIESGIDAEVCYVSKNNKKTIRRGSVKSQRLPIKRNLNKVHQSSDKDQNVEDNCSHNSSVQTSLENTPNRQITPTKRRLDDSPMSSPSSKKSFSDSYLRSPSKESKGGVGYFVSPEKYYEHNSPTKQSPQGSPRKRSSLSLIKRRIIDYDK